MEDDYQGGGGGPGGPLGWVETHPMLALAGAVAAIFVVIFLRAKKPTTPPAAPAATGDLSGLATDASGRHIVYVPVTDYFNNINTYNDSNNPVNTTTTTVTVAPPVGSSQPPLRGQPIFGGPVVLPPIAPPIHAPVHAPVVVAPPPKSTKGQWISTYRVVGGDTLSGIAARYGTDWMTLYAHNRGTVDSTSHQHHDPIPGGPQNNIFPGEVLSVPSLT